MRKVILTLSLCSIGLMGVATTGCGEDQPNAPAQPKDLTPDFGKSTADMMKNANSGMDPKKDMPKGAAKK